MTLLSTLPLWLAYGVDQLQYVPFRDPINVDRIWIWLLIPLALLVSVVYKAIKLEHIRQLPRQALIMFAQIIIFMVLAGGLVLWLSESL